MMKKLLLTFGLVLALLLPLSATVMAQSSAGAQAACDAVGSVSGAGCTTASGNNINSLITTVVNILSIVVGLVAVIMIIVGGFKFITSAGDSNNIASARNTILYAVVGLVIVALAQIIVKFVLHKVAFKN